MNIVAFSEYVFIIEKWKIEENEKGWQKSLHLRNEWSIKFQSNYENCRAMSEVLCYIVGKLRERLANAFFIFITILKNTKKREEKNSTLREHR